MSLKGPWCYFNSAHCLPLQTPTFTQAIEEPTYRGPKSLPGACSKSHLQLATSANLFLFNTYVWTANSYSLSYLFWARLKRGAKSCSLVSHMSGRYPSTWIIINCYSEFNNRKLGKKWNDRDSKQHSILGYMHSILGYRHSILGYRHSILGYKHSIPGYRHSILGYRHSILGYKHSKWLSLKYPYNQ